MCVVYREVERAALPIKDHIQSGFALIVADGRLFVCLLVARLFGEVEISDIGDNQLVTGGRNKGA